MTVGELIEKLSNSSSPLGEIPDVMNLDVKVCVKGKTLPIAINHVGMSFASEWVDLDPTKVREFPLLKPSTKLIVIGE